MSLIKPQIDWKRKYYINNVISEAESDKIWHLTKARVNRVGRKTPTKTLRKLFPKRTHMKSAPVYYNENIQRSADITGQRIELISDGFHRYVWVAPLGSAPIFISEHAIKQYYRRQGGIPDVASWFKIPACTDPGIEHEAIAIPEGLLLADVSTTPDALALVNLDLRYTEEMSLTSLRATTFITLDMMRPEQHELHAELMAYYEEKKGLTAFDKYINRRPAK